MNHPPAPRAGRREWLGLAVLGLPTFLVSMDFSVLFLAVPEIAADLAPSGSQQLWIVDVYGFLIAGFLVTMGTIGDRIGRRRLLLAGSAAFGLASIAAAFSTSPEMLIASRAALGISGAAVMPSVLAMVISMFSDAGQRSRALAVYLACFMGGATMGPLVGGVLLEFFWWGSVFLIAVPGVVVLQLLGPSLLPDERAPGTGRLDPLSVMMSLAAILPFAYGVKELARHGWAAAPTTVLLVGVAMGVVFVARQRRLTEPLLDLSVFSNRTFRAALLLFFVTALVGSGSLLLVAVYLQSVTGLAPVEAGLLLLVPNVVMILGNLATPTIARRIRPAHLIAGGLIVAAIGYSMFALSGATTGPATIFVAMCVVMLGTAPLAALCNQLAMSTIPAEKAGSGAAVVQTTVELALGFGVATLATLGAAVYRRDVESSLTDLPGGVADAARESLDRAVGAASQLEGIQRGEFLDAARDAFASGMAVVGLLSAVVYVGLAVLSLRAFGHVPTMTEAEDSDAGALTDRADSDEPAALTAQVATGDRRVDDRPVATRDLELLR